jgi:two-component system, NtrC family, sensor histidine kinase HydH
VRGEWIRRCALIASVLLVGICQERAPAADQWREFWHHLYYLPIVVAALYDGWRIGLLVAAVSILSLLHSIFRNGPTISEVFRAERVDPLVFCAIALLVGRYTDRARQEKDKHRLVSEQLAEVYEKLQTNFDGMKRAERLSAIGQLSAGLAHEIRNPLASIAGAASILRKAEPLDAKASKCVDIIVSECKRLNGLLTTFLNFARPRPPQLQRVSINGILDGVMAGGNTASLAD